ncbi:YdgA family protein [Myxococcota bacterium]|nr:YdgA family protein [Myxococcota bacterium]
MWTRRLLIALGILLFILLGLVPIGIGFGIERQYWTTVGGFEGSNSRIQMTGEFNRGLWVSEATTWIELGAGDAALFIQVEQAFLHGPVPWGEIFWGRSPLTWAVTVVDSRIAMGLPSEGGRATVEAGGASLQAELVTWVRFDRAIDGLWRSAEWRTPGESIWMDPLRANFRAGFTEDGLSLGFLELEGLRLGGPTRTFALETLRLSRAGSAVTGHPQGIAWDFENLAIGGANGLWLIDWARGHHRGVDGMTEGVLREWEWSLGSISWSSMLPEPGPVFQLEGLTLGQTWRSEGPSGLLSWRVATSMNRVVLPGLEGGGASLAMAGRHFDAAPLSSLVTGGAEESDFGVSRFQAALSQFLARSPEWILESLVIELPSGPLTGKGRVQIDGSDPSLLSDPMMRWMLIQAEFEWRLPEAAVEKLIDAYLIRQVRTEMVGVPESELAEMAAFLRLDLIDSALDQGWLRRGSDGYAIDFRLEQGFPEVNGQMVDPTRLLGALGDSS